MVHGFTSTLLETFFLYIFLILVFWGGVFLLFFSVRLLSVLRGHSFFLSPPQRPMTSDLVKLLYQLLSINLFIYLQGIYKTDIMHTVWYYSDVLCLSDSIEPAKLFDLWYSVCYCIEIHYLQRYESWIYWESVVIETHWRRRAEDVYKWRKTRYMGLSVLCFQY